MTAGITKLDPRIRAAMTLPLLPTIDPQLSQILKDIVEGILYVFQTINRYSFAINGPISLAFETAIANLMNENESVMIVIHGTSPGQLVDKDHLKSTLESHKPKILFLCDGDHSVGTLQPLRGIGAICHQNNCLFGVDGSCTVGCAPLSADQMEVDVLIAGTEYALGLSPGLSLISFSQRALDIIRQKKDRMSAVSYSMNFDLLAQSWGLTDDSSQRYYAYYSPPVSLLYALRESLAIVAEEGLDKVIARHMKASLYAQNEITKIGLRFLVSEESKRLFSVVVVLVPNKIKREAITEYLLKYYDIEISEGISPTDKVWRIGILGPNANRQTVKIMTVVLRDAIEKAKKSCQSKSSSSALSDN